MNEFENALFIKYFDQLTVSIKHNITELQQSLTHINAIKAEAFNLRTLRSEKNRAKHLFGMLLLLRDELIGFY